MLGKNLNVDQLRLYISFFLGYILGDVVGHWGILHKTTGHTVGLPPCAQQFGSEKIK
jgi:hypothetical protein